ncbi:MAG TPA: translocation/assembly module TamB domain-containing protein, partial [Puia sp.]|nr:translocation/assembly module TamB domain-containing protein [Puia sp.]
DVITFVPSLKNIQQPHIDQIRQLHFTGNFFGTINNFTTSGTITTNIGSMVTNLSMQFPSRGPTVYSGTLLTNDLELGKLMGDSSLGAISFRGRVSGSGLAMNTANAVLDGNIREMNYLGYRYTDIFVNGQATKKRFNGTIISKDSNLLATLNGLIDFSGPTPKFDFDASIDNADLRTLHFVKDSLIFNGKLRFNFSGNDIDHFLGKARIYDATLIKKGERLSFDSLVVASDIIDSSKTITVMSNEFEGAIVGEFSIHELPAAFQEFLHRYYPSYIKPNTQKLSAEKFSFVITTRNVDPYLDLFDKNISGFNMTNITGRINSTENLLNLNASIPEFSYKSINFYKVDLRANGNFDSLSADTRIAEVYINDSLHFPSTHIHVRSFNDLSDVQFTTSANQTLNAANVSAQVQTLSDGARIKFNPSTFDINSKTWTIDKNGELSFSKNIVGANALRIYSGQQQILVSTHPSGEGNWNDVHIEIQKVNIGDFTPFFVPDERIEGLLTGTADITDPFNHTDLRFNGHAEEFRFSNDSIGKLTLEADYNKQSGMVNTRVHSDNMDYHFDLTGVINTADSATQPINIMVPNIVNTRIDLLQKYLDGVFSNVTGYATGQLQIVGTGHDLNYIGDLQLKSGSLHVNYTQCTYKIPNATVHLRADRIDFGSFQVTDSLGNKAEVSKSVIYHHSWRDMRYDFVINTNKLLLLNTTIADNNQFYGTMIGSANVRLIGPQEDLQMYIKGAPTDSSNIFIPTTTSRESADADFIVWKVYGKEMKPQRMLSGQENFTVNVDVTANNYANIYLIIDPLTRDIIKATGHGNLQLQVGTNTNMNMRGKYEIDRGNYNFSFQSFIRKPFVFMEGADNYIQWTGDPYNADINIQAVYSAENVQFADLDLSDKILQGSDKLRSYHGTVWVIANLTDKLMHPAITFDIQLPPNSELRNDFYTTALLNQYIVADPNELNKQVAFLLVFNSFGPLSLTGSAISANEAVGGIFFNSISGFISSALSTRFSSIFQNVFKDKSIRVNFNTSFYNGMGLSDATDRTYDRTNLNMSVIKSFLNERLTFTVGSALDFGLTEQQMQYAAVQFLPNVTAEWKITQNGRIVLTFFYRDSYNYLNVNNHATNSSGTSISYRRDFDRVDEIFGKKKKTETDSVEVKNNK